jgi:copper chaperone NosL
MSHLSRLSRGMTLAGALLLGALYIAPLWSIRLLAPQYPEGLGMLIRVNAIDGMKENDLRSINALNHYIGMRPIEASAIPELRYMPWIVAGLIVSGVVVALVGRRRLLAGWVVGFAALGVAGLFDFWRWGYTYGHNLDVENAIITVPGMTYQPPLIGTKQLLNFTATSWPDVGGVLAGIAFLLGVGALVIAYRHRAGASARSTVGAAALAVSAACAVGPQAIRFGIDICTGCHMVVSDSRFGAEIVTRTGKTLAFDSIECMKSYLAGMPAGEAREVWVVDANHPGTLIRSAESRSVSDGVLHPPMGTTYTVLASAKP